MSAKVTQDTHGICRVDEAREKLLVVPGSRAAAGMVCRFELSANEIGNFAATTVQVTATTTAIVQRWQVTQTPQVPSCVGLGDELGVVKIEAIGDTRSLNRVRMSATGQGSIDFYDDREDLEIIWMVKVVEKLDDFVEGTSGLRVALEQQGDDIYDPSDAWAASWDLQLCPDGG